MFISVSEDFLTLQCIFLQETLLKFQLYSSRFHLYSWSLVRDLIILIIYLRK